MFSGEGFSAPHTGGYLAMVLGWFHIKLSPESLAVVHFVIRKSAHFVVYGILSALFFRALRGPLPEVNWRMAWALAALAVCLVTASADEIHQAYTPGRGGSAYDVALDMAGALFAQLAIWLVMVRRRGR